MTGKNRVDVKAMIAEGALVWTMEWIYGERWNAKIRRINGMEFCHHVGHETVPFVEATVERGWEGSQRISLAGRGPGFP